MKLRGAFRHLLFPILPPCYELLTHHQLENWAIAALKNNAKVKGKIRFSKGKIAAIQGNLQGKLFLTRGEKHKKMFCRVPRSMDTASDANLAKAWPAARLLSNEGDRSAN